MNGMWSKLLNKMIVPWLTRHRHEVVIPGYVWKESEVPAVKVLLGNTKPFLAASVSDIPSVAKRRN